MAILREGRWVAAWALCLLAAPSPAQTSASDKQMVTGSHIPRAPEYRQVANDRARLSAHRFAACVQRRNSELVAKLLRSSDPVTIDFEGAGLTSGNFTRRLTLESCLGEEALADTIQLRVQPGELHEMLTEPAYLAGNPVPPAWLTNTLPESSRRYFTKGAQLPLARARGELSDCLVRAAPLKADAVLRTPVGSDEERAAAVNLATALGECLYEGQTLELTPANIRGWAASGLWELQATRIAVQGNVN